MHLESPGFSRLTRNLTLAVAALTLGAVSRVEASSGYGILWHQTVTGEFGVWQVSEHGTVFGAYGLMTSNSVLYPPDGTFRCGTHEPDGTSCSDVFPVTEIFPGPQGFDFLSYSPNNTGFMSDQLSNFSGAMTIPGNGFVDTSGRLVACGGTCAQTWKMIGAGNVGGYPSLFWYDATDHLFGAWQMSPWDHRTVLGYPSWAACGGGGCGGYGDPIGVADINNDGVSDIVWRDSFGTLTVFLENSDHSYRTNVLSRSVPWYAAVFVGVRAQFGVADMVWYNQFTGALQTWIIENTGSYWDVWEADPLTWGCSNCGAWTPVGLVPLN